MIELAKIFIDIFLIIGIIILGFLNIGFYIVAIKERDWHMFFAGLFVNFMTVGFIIIILALLIKDGII